MTNFDSAPSNILDCRAKSLWFLDRTLAADRFGDIQTVLVDAATVENARAVVDRCWHDAEVVTQQTAYITDRAA